MRYGAMWDFLGRVANESEILQGLPALDA